MSQRKESRLQQPIRPHSSLRFFRWLEGPLHWLVQPTVSPDKSTLGPQQPGKPVVYITANQSVADLLVIERLCRRQHLPQPSKPLIVAGQIVSSSSYTYLSRIGFYKKVHDDGAGTSTQLQRLITLAKSDLNFDLDLVPVSILWGRNPGREERSLMKLLFFDDEHAGVLQKFFIVLAQGRRCHVRFSSPISLREFINEEILPEQQSARKLRRVLRVHFRRQRIAALGPVFYDRNQAIKQVVSSRQVKEAIDEEMRKRSFSRERVEGKAVHYAREISADARYSVIRFFDIILTWLWHKMFDGIDVRNVDRIPPLAESHSIIYVPCHRSHLDYLLISYSLFQAGITPPHTAAGINLNFWPAGPFLRRSGAFYIRRTFKGNRLYGAVFNEYVHFLVSKGYSIKFFLEGGRSRTGKLLHPKTGMLSMVVQSFLRNPEKSVALVPVYVGYDKVMEVKTYLRELRGNVKRQESIGEIFKARKALKSSHGKAYLSFGEPIILSQFLDHAQPEWQAEAGKLDHRPTWLSPVVEDMALEVMRRINSSTIVSPMSLLSLALLSTAQKAMPEDELIASVEALSGILRACKYGPDVTIPDMSGRELLQRCEKFAPLRRFKHPGGDVIYLEESDSSIVNYYRNNSLHLFALPALVASFFQHNDQIEVDALIDGCRLLYPFIAEEYFLRWPEQEVVDVIRGFVENMLQSGFFESLPEVKVLRRPPITSGRFGELLGLGRMMGQALERYAIAAVLLQQRGEGEVVARTSFETQCALMAQRISILSGVKDPDIFDKSVFQNLFDVLKTQKYVETAADGTLKINQGISFLAERSLSLLSHDVRQTIERTSKLTLIQVTTAGAPIIPPPPPPRRTRS